MEPTVTDNTHQHRWEAAIDGQLVGYATYDLADGAVTLIHTVVEPGHEGQGLAGRLVGAALGAARGSGLAVLPACPYARSWLARHPDQVDLVPADRRAEFGL